MTTRAVAALAVVLCLGAGCERSVHAPPASPGRCEVPLTVPDGFHAVGGIEDPQSDRIGVRIDLRDDQGRELHYFSGIRGEFGEGLTERGELRLRDGRRATLLGGDTTWVLSWTTPEPCAPNVVLGSGMREEAFRALMREAGALSRRE